MPVGAVTVITVKLVVQVWLLPTAADQVSRVAFERKVFSRAGLQKLMYAQMKALGLSAQPALHAIRKTADAYTALHAGKPAP